MVVGASWLNKIGVLVFVVGMALLVGYSMAHVVPAGRVAIGLALSAAMLASGIVLERREAYRNYAYGLVAGGWAGTYFTTYALRAIEAARLTESDLAGTSLLLLVAAAMVVHTLRYRSQTVTALAYVVAYATLALTPLSGFSVVASIFLAASLLGVAQRFGWSRISTLGLVSTYGIFVLRGQVFPGGVMDPFTLTPYLMLAAMWVTFEGADVIGLRNRAPGQPRPAPLFVLNAAGALGAALVLLPIDADPLVMARFSAWVTVAYLTSAVVRAGLLGRSARPGQGRQPDSEAERRPFTFGTVQAAVAIAAACAAWSIDLRFSGTRETLALLLETQMLVAAGVTLRDPDLRRMGLAGAALVTAHALWTSFLPLEMLSIPSASRSAASTVALIVALTWYGNREWLRRRDVATRLDRAYTWAALVLLVAAGLHEFEPAHQGLAACVVAVVLLEAGLRRAAEYRHQAFTLGLLGTAAVILLFAVAPVPPPLREIWIVLPAVTVLAYFAAVRLARHAQRHAVNANLHPPAAVAACLGTTFFALLQLRVLPTDAVGPAWAMTALALVALGARRQIAGLRWQAYVLVLLAASRVVIPLIERAPATTAQTFAIAVVLTLMYVTGYLGRRSLSERRDGAEPSFEWQVTGVLPVMATAALALFKWRVLPPWAVGPAWAVTAVILACLGLARGRIGQRAQGYALASVAAWHAVVPLLERAWPSSADVSAAATVAALVYLTAYAARRSSPWTRPMAEATGPYERTAAVALAAIATGVLVVTERQVFEGLAIGPIWAVTAAALLSVGLLRQAADLRWQAYGVLTMAAIRSAGPVLAFGPASPAAIGALAFVIAVLYATSLSTRSAARRTQSINEIEEACRLGLSVAGSFLMTMTIWAEVPASLLTLAWGLEGSVLLAAGFPTRERVLRLSGLALLFVCILKLFVYDLSALEAIARILSFVLLGLVLLAISWTYTRYRDWIKRYL